MFAIGPDLAEAGIGLTLEFDFCICARRNRSADEFRLSGICRDVENVMPRPSYSTR